MKITLSLKYPDLESVRRIIKSEVHAYIDAITVLSSLQDYLRNVGIDSHIEKRLMKKNGEPKKPDLLILSGNYIIVDHKYTESENEKTLISILEKMREYDSAFMFNNGKTSSKEINPEVVMLTPERSVRHFRGLLDCPITWGYSLDSEIAIKQMIGAVKDSRVSSLFSPDLTCTVAEEISKYKFFISHPPLSYTSCEIYHALWTLSPSYQFFAPEFEVKYDDILDVFNTSFPPWICHEARQLNITRLNDALDFLQKIGWIKWFKAEKLVIVYRKKGRLIADLLSYLIDCHVKIEHEKAVIRFEKEIKKQEQLQKPVAQKKLADFA